MLKKVSACLFIVCLIAGILMGCQSSEKASENKEVTEIRVAFNQNENHPQYLAMKKLGEEFEKATNGRYKMTIYPNGVLGEQGAMAEFVRTGALQMAIVPCSVPEGYDKDFAIVGAPYLYDGIDHMEKVVLHGVFDDLFYSARKYNFQVLMVYTAGERNVYSNKPINSAADLAGQIIRVNDSPTYIEMTKLMGELVQPCLSQRFIQLCSRVSLMQLKTVSLYIMTLRTMKWQNIIHIQNILFIQTL
mgnify:CR=1 FL=1